MKKRSLLLVLCVMLVCALCACGKKDNGDTNKEDNKQKTVKTDVKVADIINKVKEADIAKDFVNSIDANTIEYIYLNLDMDMVEDAAGIYISDKKVDEVTIIKAKQGKTGEIENILKDRVEDQKNISKQYDQEQYERLCNADNFVVKTYGDYVVLVIASDNKKIVDIIENMLYE